MGDGGVIEEIEERELPPVSDEVAKYAPTYARTTERVILVGQAPDELPPVYYVGVVLKPVKEVSEEAREARNPYMVAYAGADLAVALDVADGLEAALASNVIDETAGLRAKFLGPCERRCEDQNRFCLIDANLTFFSCLASAASLAQEALCALRLELAYARCALQFNWCWTLCQPV